MQHNQISVSPFILTSDNHSSTCISLQRHFQATTHVLDDLPLILLFTAFWRETRGKKDTSIAAGRWQMPHRIEDNEHRKKFHTTNHHACLSPPNAAAVCLPSKSETCNVNSRPIPCAWKDSLLRDTNFAGWFLSSSLHYCPSFLRPQCLLRPFIQSLLSLIKWYSL